ncbi:MAG: DUF1847 domain-containing protein [Rhodospirillaceae bacterium]|nr:DUF1847 domain-containing protein [Rhodospirillaceae bacterium]
MDYRDPSCAYCPETVRVCRHGELQGRPGFCPTRVEPDAITEGRQAYEDERTRAIAVASAQVEAEGYCRWSRVEEVCQFAHKMGFKRIGIACCISFVDFAQTLSTILESHGFEVVSSACKVGGVPKEDLGLRDDQKVRPGGFEAMCNPVTQAKVMNDAGTDFNVLMGLCVGHDSLFLKHADALCTVLVAKDRVLAHNPLGALVLADSYFRRVWGPDKPDRKPKLPAEGRRKP